MKDHSAPVAAQTTTSHPSMRRSTTPSSPADARCRLARLASTLGTALLVAAALAGLGSCNSSPTKRQLQYMNQDGFGKRYVGNPEEEEYVTLGDTIQILDVNHPEVSLTREVASDGTVLLPEVGRINVAGYRRSEVESILKQRYSPYYDTAPEIVVNISISTRVVFVIGEVAREGEFPFEGNQTIFELVVEAQPMMDSANLGRIVLIRPDPVDPLHLQFNYRDFVPGGDSSTNYALQENDIIWVPPTLVAEFGYFLRGLLFPVTTVFQAIGGALFMAGGQGGLNNRGRAGGVGGVGFGGFF